MLPGGVFRWKVGILTNLLRNSNCESYQKYCLDDLEGQGKPPHGEWFHVGACLMIQRTALSKYRMENPKFEIVLASNG